MADKINAAGYETKPWWPYVRELMEGGGSVTVEQLNVTENGTYTAEAGKAYSPVVVNVPSDFPTVTVTLKSSVSTATSEDDNIGFDGQGVDGDGYPTVTALYKYDTHYTLSYVFDVTTPERVVDIMMCGESFSIIAFHPMTATGSATVETVSDPSGSYYKATVTGDCELTISDLT